MLEMMLESHALYVAMGILAAVGILSKCMVNVTLKRLVRASGSMSKSNHPLMRLVRAKFEHACMISDTVGNVDVFVDKYLFEYKVAGVRLHSLRRMEKAAAGACIVVGILGSVLWYSTFGMGEAVLKLAGVGAALGIFVYLFHLTTMRNTVLRRFTIIWWTIWKMCVCINTRRIGSVQSSQGFCRM